MNNGAYFAIGLLVVNIPIFLLIGRRMFGSWSGFWEDAKWNLIPDFWSLLRGRFFRDMLGEGRAKGFVVICFVLFLVELIVIRALFDPWR